MANTSYGYVRSFEAPDSLPPSNWIVVRIDGRGFSKLTSKYAFTKPNDIRALDLMNAAAVEVTRSLVDIVLAYGQSDEYSFVLHENTTLFDRRSAKLATTIATTFTAEYCMLWPQYFPDTPLTRPFPTFDARCVCYPKRRILRDYLCWRQADCHINNLYNTTFWNMVIRGEQTQTDAELELKGSLAGDKNEILFKRFGINYNNEPLIFRKGSVVYRKYDDVKKEESFGGLVAKVPGEDLSVAMSRSALEKERKRKMKAEIVVEHVDLIQKDFWEARPYILAGKRGVVDDE